MHYSDVPLCVNVSLNFNLIHTEQLSNLISNFPGFIIKIIKKRKYVNWKKRKKPSIIYKHNVFSDKYN